MNVISCLILFLSRPSPKGPLGGRTKGGCVRNHVLLFTGLPILYHKTKHHHLQGQNSLNFSHGKLEKTLASCPQRGHSQVDR